jgi:hypothetical protein
MAGRMISELSDATTLQNTDLIPLARGATTLKVSGLTLVNSLTSVASGAFASKTDLTSLSSTVDTKLSTYLPLSGGTMTGTVNISSVTETKQTPAISANTLTLNLDSAVVFHVNLDSNITTFTLTNVPPSPRVYSFALQLSADGTTRSVVWPTGTRWSGGSTPILTTTAGKVDTFTFLTHDGGSNWFAFTNNQNQ